MTDVFNEEWFRRPVVAEEKSLPFVAQEREGTLWLRAIEVADLLALNDVLPKAQARIRAGIERTA